jgi:membrane associated rhomboid family serine protease
LERLRGGHCRRRGRQRGDLKDEPRAIVLIDRASGRLLITLALIGCGSSLIAGHFGGLYWLAGAHVGALLAGLLNAWIFFLSQALTRTTDRR